QTSINVDYKITRSEDEQEVTVILDNPTDTIAFFIELNLYGKQHGESVLPIFWKENYISLLPGEHREVNGRYYGRDLHGDSPGLRVSGWNVKPRAL
ncbi:MAG: glycoside hydrolase family 2, partial [Calditrichota bacterium]